MSPFERVRRTQRALQVVIGGSVLFWAIAACFGILTIGAVLGGLVALPVVVRGLFPILAIIAALVTLGVLGWRGRFVWSFNRVALWIEERFPELRYALVTAIDPRYQGATAKLMEPAIAKADPAPFVRSSALRSLLPATAAMIAVVVIFMAIPSQWRKQITNGSIFGPLGGKSTVVGNRLVPLMGTLTPPAYAHMRTETLNEPSMITGLMGSKIVLTGSGSPDGIQATLTEFPPDESGNIAVGDSANDDSEQYEEAQAAAQQQQQQNQGSYDQNGAGQGMGMPGMPGMPGGMSRPDQSGMRPNDDQGGYGNRSMNGMNGMNGLNGQSQGQPQPKAAQQKKAKTPPAKAYKRTAVRQVHRQPPIVKAIPVTAGGKGWMITITLSDSNPGRLELVDRKYHRYVVINPQADQPPTGRLLLPVRDTTLRVVEGTLSMSATFSDDIGLGTAQFTYIKCSAGASDEDFKCVPGVYATKPLGDAKTGAFSYSVPFSSLGLKEGDQLSIRAVVTDNNTLYGPDTGVTETRTIRIARKSEYEKLNVNPAPPSADTALTTLRMLLMAVKNLDSVKAGMEHKVYEDSSIKLAGVAGQARNKVDQIIDEQTGGGEVPINPLLALARDSMVNVVTDLSIADTHTSIPPLQAAYDSLMKYSNTAKYYLRGIIPPPIVNIDRVRLKGTDSGATTPRTPRPMSDQDRERFTRDYVNAIQQLQTSKDAGIDAMTLLQVETLRKYPNLAQAIADAVSAVRAKKDPGGALVRARKILSGSSETLETLPQWSGAW